MQTESQSQWGLVSSQFSSGISSSFSYPKRPQSKTPEPKSLFIPKTRAEIFFSTSHGEFSLKWFKLQEIIKLDLGSKFALDIGISAYTRESIYFAEVLPRLSYFYNENLAIDTVLGKDSYGIGLRLFNIKNTDFGILYGFSHGKSFFRALAKKQLPNSVTLTINAEITRSIFIKTKKQFKNFKASADYDIRPHKKTLGLSFKKQFSCESSGIIRADIEKTHIFSVKKLSAGVGIELGKYTKLCYILENMKGSLFWRIIFKHGGLNFQVPIKLENIPVFIGALAIGGAAYITRRIYSYFTPKDSKIEEKSRKQSCMSFVEMIKNNVETDMKNAKLAGRLVITKALYGNKDKIHTSQNLQDEVLDVTLALNFMINNNQIQLPPSTKQFLQGFYLVCENPILFIEYEIGNYRNVIIVEDNQGIILP
ncbi:hypothetical protein SteCoe_20147 [Stentor coeruleus]|uniref:DnaJ-like protein C11 C-terminal domain-containing protein n=1 Tax=Stentor coeruleus TaxID=5963 RepID=A0A1R2BSM9_9CILI|nr:hypothetical protein SteCoe_20147 [Stentor coeruleus]